MRILVIGDIHGHNSWKAIVKNEKYDKVVFLGDYVDSFTLQPLTIVKNLRELLKFKRQNKDKVVLLWGNHDHKRCCVEYQRLGIPVMGVLEYKGFFCTHVPIHPHELDFCRGNIHGHIHKKGTIDGWEYNPQSLGERYYNVNCEFHDYTPVPFSVIEDYFINLKKEDNE